MSQSPAYHIGVDIGGSKTDVLVRSGTQTTSLRAKGGNLRLDPASEWVNRLETCLEDIITLRQPVRMVIGAAGGASREAAAALESALLERSREQSAGWLAHLVSVRVVSDTRIAWQGAFGGEPGIILIAGTGSGCYTVDADGGQHRAGGWGPVIGDPGSGRAIGVAALRHMLTCVEAVRFSMTADRIAHALQDGARVFGPDAVDSGALLDAFYARKMEASELAPVVLKAYADGCPDARDILLDEAGQLAGQCVRLAARTEPARRRIALVGGLVNDRGYAAILEAALTADMPDCDIVEPAASPVQGALDLAASAAK